MLEPLVHHGGLIMVGSPHVGVVDGLAVYLADAVDQFAVGDEVQAVYFMPAER